MELLGAKRTSFSEDDLSCYLNKFHVKLMLWAQSVSGSNALVCLKLCVIQSASYAAFLEHFAKAWLVFSILLAV